MVVITVGVGALQTTHIQDTHAAAEQYNLFIGTDTSDIPCVKFSNDSPLRVHENAEAITVTVEIDTYPDHEVSVAYAVQEDTASMFEDFLPTSGTLTFTPQGSLTHSFVVPIVDNDHHTVLCSLPIQYVLRFQRQYRRNSLKHTGHRANHRASLVGIGSQGDHCFIWNQTRLFLDTVVFDSQRDSSWTLFRWESNVTRHSTLTTLIPNAPLIASVCSRTTQHAT
jgi:hypothetical protein